ncbi:hypothetical protein M3699_27670, partial [Peribacillus simplex]|uniref:hypothetical protein n=1 Tax=Peribacillus simplex TaxID=1478 RepID=UPI0020420AAB
MIRKWTCNIINMMGSYCNNFTIIKKGCVLNCTPIVRQHLTIGGAVFLTKYTIDEKSNAVLEYLEGKKSYK